MRGLRLTKRGDAFFGILAFALIAYLLTVIYLASERNSCSWVQQHDRAQWEIDYYCGTGR